MPFSWPLCPPRSATVLQGSPRGSLTHLKCHNSTNTIADREYTYGSSTHEHTLSDPSDTSSCSNGSRRDRPELSRSLTGTDATISCTCWGNHLKIWSSHSKKKYRSNSTESNMNEHRTCQYTRGKSARGIHANRLSSKWDDDYSNVRASSTAPSSSTSCLTERLLNCKSLLGDTSPTMGSASHGSTSFYSAFSSDALEGRLSLAEESDTFQLATNSATEGTEFTEENSVSPKMRDSHAGEYDSTIETSSESLHTQTSRKKGFDLDTSSKHATSHNGKILNHIVSGIGSETRSSVCDSANQLISYPVVQKTEDKSVIPAGVRIIPNSYEDKLMVARTLIGKWLTVLPRSDSLDAQYKVIGIGLVKRAIMNRLAVPLTMFLENKDTILHCWIHTPIGLRHMRSSLTNEECVDEDPDAGKWTGVTQVIDYSIPWYRDGAPIRALQQRRCNEHIGISIETRCVLQERDGKVMLFNFTMIPKGKPESESISANRILKFVSADID